MQPLRPARILLVGMMGSGKSTLGAAISAATGWPYVDNDEAVRELCGLATPQLLAERGVAALREVESRALAAVLERDPPVVAGVAGGVVESPADRARLAGPEAFVVFLDAPLEVLTARVRAGGPRPWLGEDPDAALRRLLEGRGPLYREVADLVVDTSRGDAADQADRVLAAVRVAQD